MGVFLKTMIFALAATTFICATPLSRREIDADADDDDASTETTPDVATTELTPDVAATTAASDVPVPPKPVIEEEIVIHKHEDEDLIKESADGVPEVVHRDIDEYIEPNGEAIIVVSESEDDLFDVAESGLVFRPRFHYSQVQRRRRFRTPVRRYYRRRY